MKNRRILSLLLCAIMVLTSVNFVMPAAAADAVYYVDAQAGSEMNDGMSAQTAFSTLATAVTAAQNAGGGTIKIIGAVSHAGALPAHSNKISIIGNTNAQTDSLHFASGEFANGPLAIDNLTLTAGGEIYMMEFDVEIGENAVFDYNNFFHLGMYATGSADGYRATINSKGNVGYVITAPNRITSNQNVGPVDIVVGGESSGIIIVGARTSDADRKVNHTAPASFTLNNDNWDFYAYGWGRYPYFNNGLQVICNNGATFGFQLNAELVFTDSTYHSGGKWILYSADKTGNALASTDTAGTFKVVGGSTAVATNRSTSEVYRSVGTTLIVPAGTYDITYEEAAWSWEQEADATEAYLYVDAANGNDANRGTTAATALKSFDAAIVALDTLSERFTKREIRIVGDYSLTAFQAHSKMITFTGADENASLAVESDYVSLNGPTTFENLVFSNSAAGPLVTDGNELILGEGLSYKTTSLGWLIGSISKNTGHEKVTIKSGDHSTIWLGTHGYTIDGITLNLEGGSSTGIWYGSLGTWANGAVFTDSIDIIYNGGSFGYSSRYPSYKTNPVYAGVQLILNNGNSATVPAGLGTAVFSVSSAEGDGKLLPGEIIGEYIVVGDKIAKLENGDGDAYYSHDGKVAVPAGTYTATYLTEDEAADEAVTITFDGDALEGTFFKGEKIKLPVRENTMDKEFAGWLYDGDVYGAGSSFTLPADATEVSFTSVWNEVSGVAYRYVDAANGSDSNLGTSSASAYATIGKAIADLEELDDSYSVRKVLIVGTYTQADAMCDYSSMITISGAEGNSSVFAFSELTLGGPTTFENITLRDTAQWKSLYTNEHELVWGKSVEIDTTNGYSFGVHLGNTDKDAQSELKFTMNGGAVDSVAVGTSYNTVQREVPGATVTINDGTTKIYFGESKGWNDTGVGVKYTEDVNVVFNGGNSTISYFKPYAGKNPVFDKGFHLIMNNGADYGTIANAMEGKYNGGKWEMFSAAGSAGALAPTGETGKFKVVGENVAARAQNRTTKQVYFSDADGYLTVPADYYDVAYITNYRQGSVCRFVDSKNGSDSNDGTTLANAYATIGAAIADLDSLEGSYSYREVRIVGEYTLSETMPAHENMITILGNTGAQTDTINLNTGNIANGPIAFENITISADVEISAENQDVVIGENVVFDYTSFFHLGMNKAGSDKAYNLVLDGGNFGGYVVAGPRFLTADAEVAGAEITISSGTGAVILGSKNSTTTNKNQNVHYTAPVNITLNVDGWNLYSYGYARMPYFDGGIQVVVNNGAGFELQQGMPDVFSDSKYFEGGKWEIYGAAAEGSSLEITDTLGIYKVNGDLCAVATEYTTGAVYASSNGVLSVPAGVYNVTYTEDEYFTNDGNTLTVNEDVTVSFASVPHDNTIGRVFLGWKNELGEYVEDGSLLEAGTILTAEYKTIDASYTDSSDKADFGIKGAQVRTPLDETVPQGLRFVVERSNSLGRAVDTTEFGSVILPKNVVGEEELVIGGSYTYNYEEYEAAFVPARKIYKTLGDRVYYTIVVTGITNEKLARDYIVRGYNKYIDGNGVEQILYTDDYSTSILSVAEYALENDADITEEEIAVMQNIRKDAYTRTDYSDFIAYRTNLSNTYNKLMSGEEVNVVYLGGSVTHGTGASVGDRTSWRALSGFYLKEMFPDAKINTYNAAIGESGTHLGTFRLERDIMPLEPDLFVLEYAINDSYHLGMDDEVNAPIKAASMYETIVRELRTAYPEVDIFGLVVTDKIHIGNYPETNLFNTARGHVAMAEHYDISLLNVGLAAQKKVDLVNNWSLYFGDNAHPNDRGYLEYYKCVEEFLYNQLVNPYTISTYGDEIVEHELAPMKSDSLLDGNRTTATAAQLAGLEENNSTTQLVDTTFKYVDEVFKHVSDETEDYVGYYEATSTDQYITFTFSGTEFALYTTSYSRNGIENLSVSIDGGDFVDIALTNYNPSPVYENLEPAVHTVTIKPTFSSGTYTSLKIGVIYTRDDSLATRK